jgi:hypothetical protein
MEDTDTRTGTDWNKHLPVQYYVTKTKLTGKLKTKKALQT